MDVRNSSLVALAVLLLSVALVTVTLSGVWFYGTPTPTADKVEPRTLPSSRGRSLDRSNIVAQLAATRTRAADLETRLAEAQRRLASQARSLEREQKRNEELEDEIERSLNLAMQLVGPSSSSAPRTPTKRNADDKTTDVEPPLQTREEVLAELELVRRQLNDSEQEMALLELSSDQELDGLLATSNSFRDAVGQIMVNMGGAAVDAVLPALEHREPEVREWAAEVLGAIGPGAAEAATALREASSRDRDPTVRDAARRALAQVTD